MSSKFFNQFVNRNIGVVTTEEQEQLRKSTVAVAGCGGMGGLAAEQLVRMGVGGINIADFDQFETHNLSRQAQSTFFNVGTHKAAIIASHLLAINPELKIRNFLDGVQPNNVEEFLDGVEAVIDAIDYTQFYHSVILHREANRKGLTVVNPGAVGFGAAVLVFGPNTMSIEEYVGLEKNSSREEIENFKIPIEKFAPYMPSYIDPEVAMKAAMGEINIPNIIMPQHLGTSISVSETVMMILGRVPDPVGPDPRIFVVDLQDRKFEVTG